MSHELQNNSCIFRIDDISILNCKHVIEKHPKRLIHVCDRKVFECSKIWNECIDNGGYATVSYTWDNNGCMVPGNIVGWNVPSSASTNLDVALSISKNLGIQWLWMDAWCIDQNNTSEKEIEVYNMGTYYENAIICIVLLPDITITDVDQLLQYYEMVVNKKYEDNESNVDKRMSNILTSIWQCPLVRCKWISRRWTLQETICSTKLIAGLHGKIIDIDAIMSSINSYYDNKDKRIIAVAYDLHFIRNSREINFDDTYEGYNEYDKFSILLKVAECRSKITRNNMRIQAYQRLSFADAIVVANRRKCTIPEDTIYSIIGLLKNCTVKVNYGKAWNKQKLLLDIILDLKKNEDHTWLQLGSTSPASIGANFLFDMQYPVIVNKESTPTGEYDIATDDNGLFIQTNAWNHGEILSVETINSENNLYQEEIARLLPKQLIDTLYVKSWQAFDGTSSLKRCITQQGLHFLVNGNCTKGDIIMSTGCNVCFAVRPVLTETLQEFFKVGLVENHVKLHGQPIGIAKIYIFHSYQTILNSHFLLNIVSLLADLIAECNDCYAAYKYMKFSYDISVSTLGYGHFAMYYLVYLKGIESNNDALVDRILSALERITRELDEQEIINAVRTTKLFTFFVFGDDASSMYNKVINITSNANAIRLYNVVNAEIHNTTHTFSRLPLYSWVIVCKNIYCNLVNLLWRYYDIQLCSIYNKTKNFAQLYWCVFLLVMCCKHIYYSLVSLLWRYCGTVLYFIYNAFFRTLYYLLHKCFP